MKRIDLHNHVIPQGVIDAVIADQATFETRIEGEGDKRRVVRKENSFPLVAEYYDADAKVEAMERKGIDISMLSAAPPTFYYWTKPEIGLKIAKLHNDGIAAMVAKRPDRLRGMASLPLQDVDASIAELERAVREYKFKAVEMQAMVNNQQLADPKYRPLFKTAEQLGVFVFVHPNWWCTDMGLDKYYLINMIGNPLETTIFTANMMFSGALDEVPNLRFLLAHGGGYVPYQIGRFRHGHSVRPEARALSTTSPVDHFRKFYFDCLTHNPQSTRHLIDSVGADHCVLGTDSPYDMGDETPIANLDAVPRLTPQEREQICCRTAYTLLGEAD